jgi:hypothetical protein
MTTEEKKEFMEYFGVSTASPAEAANELAKKENKDGLAKLGMLAYLKNQNSIDASINAMLLGEITGVEISSPYDIVDYYYKATGKDFNAMVKAIVTINDLEQGTNGNSDEIIKGLDNEINSTERKINESKD